MHRVKISLSRHIALVGEVIRLYVHDLRGQPYVLMMVSSIRRANRVVGVGGHDRGRQDEEGDGDRVTGLGVLFGGPSEYEVSDETAGTNRIINMVR